MRKPRAVSKGRKTMPICMPIWEADITTSLWIDLDVHTLIDPDEAEKIAAWLIKAAQWIREKEARDGE